MFTVRKILVFCQASLFPASFVSKEHGVWSPEGLSWNSGCPSAPSPWGQLSKGQESLPYRTAMRVHEKRCKRHDAADGSQQKQQACPLSLIDSDPTRPPAQWPAWTSQEEAPGPTSFTPRFCPLQQRQDPAAPAAQYQNHTKTNEQQVLLRVYETKEEGAPHINCLPW